ncbi:MAG TPA: T9SS type A sorting domain-containing protein [Fluviicola sp.]|nr:T9SS type A sorting domain-containing protein [Fluviicola sp.]
MDRFFLRAFGCVSCCFWLTSGMLRAQTEQLYTPNQVAAANPACGTTNVPAYGFAFNSTTFTNPVFTGLAGFTTSGTYVAGDILNFKLYQTNFSVFNTSNLLATISTGLGPGSHTFPAFSYTVSPSPVARYFWITVDIAGSAVNGHTIIVDPLTIAMTTITGTETAATITVGGTQTIVCALPVELLSFTGEALESGNRISWTTSSELNNDYFTVESSADGIHFSELERVDGSGSTSEKSDYVVTDKTPGKLTYYRLRQTDSDGANTLHETIAVSNGNAFPVLFPNPAFKRVSVQANDGIYRISDLTGATLRTGELQKGMNEVDVSELSDGVYILHIGETEQQKIIVRR